MSSHIALTAASDERKARLAKFKSLKRKQPSEDHDHDAALNQRPLSPQPPPSQQSQDLGPGSPAARAAQQSTPPTVASVTKDVHQHLSLRNYDPDARGPRLGFEAPPTLALPDGATLEEQVADIEAEAQSSAAAGGSASIDLLKLQPKKPNWDLKRECDRRMEPLKVRTENAIARLVRERLAAAKVARTGQGPEGEMGGKGDHEKPQQHKLQHKNQQQNSIGEEAEQDGGVLEGAALVEGIRMRQKEEEDEERRERELEEEGSL